MFRSLLFLLAIIVSIVVAETTSPVLLFSKQKYVYCYLIYCLCYKNLLRVIYDTNTIIYDYKLYSILTKFFLIIIFTLVTGMLMQKLTHVFYLHQNFNIYSTKQPQNLFLFGNNLASQYELHQKLSAHMVTLNIHLLLLTVNTIFQP